MKAILILLSACLPLLRGVGHAAANNPDTDWFKDARYGVFMHFLPGDAKGLALVKDFDVEALGGQMEAMGAKYLAITLGQNSGYFNSPNAAYEKRTGYAPGERCATRDLPLDLYRALRPKGIRLMLYLPCQVPNGDARAQKAFGLPQGAKDQPVDLAFAEKWSEVIQEWSDRYGDKVSGWWFDGGYEHIRFNDAIADRYAAAVKHGNPKAIVTFNPGVKVIRWTKAEDYTAGELNEPLQVIPGGRWLAGSQWHALTYLGDNWGRRNTRFSDDQWTEWARKVTAQQGVLTLDMGPNYDPAQGPVGSLAEAQVKQVKAIKTALNRPMGPLRVCATNPRYFADPSGRPIYLTGSHTWQSLQDGMLSNYTAVTQPFDYPGYLNLLQTNHHNFIRLWRWELTTHEPQPWQRTGPGQALDGKPKFDLRQFNQDYFDRLRSRVIAARERGIYVSIMLFEDWIFMTKRKEYPVEQHPFHQNNNVTGINGDPNGDGWGIEIHTLQVPAVLEVQKTYVRKVLETVNDLDNVLYEICNEGMRHTREWQYEMVRFIKSVEAKMPKQHPVGMTSVGDMNEDCLKSSADWTSLATTGSDQPKDPWTSAPPAADGKMVCLLDTDHLGWKIYIDDAAFTRAWVWKSFTRGHNPLLMENLANSAGWIAGRAAMGQTRRFAERMNLAAARPENRLASSGYCLAHAAATDAEYLVYLPDGGEVTVDLSASPGKLALEWFDPAHAASAQHGEVEGGASRKFKAPFDGHAILYLTSRTADNDRVPAPEDATKNLPAPGWVKDTSGSVQPGTSGAETNSAPVRLTIGVVQMALGRTIAENCARIAAGISSAAMRGVRVAVFPEGALRGKDGDQPALVDQAVSAIRQAAREAKLFVLFGGSTYSTQQKKDVNWMLVVGPDGRDVFRYEKLYDNHRAAMPGVFDIDGIPCSAIICADRWLRGIEEIPIQQGAQISFELSCNFASEWVAPFEWYWYVPRALRNNVWVIFANTGNQVAGLPDDPSAPRELRHGHSAIIAPDGQIKAAARDDAETIVFAALDVSQATRDGAQARGAHPALRPFWEAGLKLHSGQGIQTPSFTPLKCSETDITMAVAQVTNNLPEMVARISQARAKNVDLIVFPERAIAETALERLQAAARDHRITVVVGMEHRLDGGRRNAAFVIGPDGSVLTCYDQLSATRPFQPGTNLAAMWFRVKGVPAVVTIGQDALWTELAELAAVAGAQIHVHLDHDPDGSPEAGLRRLQVWSNLASFQTFAATANVLGSAIWDDLRDSDERRAEVRGLPRPATGTVEVYSPFSANLVVHAGSGSQLIIATRRVGPANLYHPRRTSSFNPQMDA